MYKIVVAMLVSLGFLTACTETYVPHPKPDITFSGTPYTLDVNTINFIEEYQSSDRPPHVEKLAAINPAEMVRKWKDARLKAAGTGSAYAEVVVKDAGIVKKHLPKQKTGLEGYFTNEQTEEYDGSLAVEIKIYDGKRNLPVAKVAATSQSSRTVAENASVADREKTYNAISEDLIRLLEKELDRNIREHFAKYLL